jgi:ABC-type Fe3+ transport system permease subunit
VTERLILIFATLLLAVIGLLPIAAMLRETVTADGGFSLNAYRALLRSEGPLAQLMGHSLQLSFLTASISTLIGVPLGVLLGKTDLPLRGFLTLLFAAPLLVPPYILAVAWFSIPRRSLSPLISWPSLGFPFLGEQGCSAASCRTRGRKKFPRNFSASPAAPSSLRPRSRRSPCS